MTTAAPSFDVGVPLGVGEGLDGVRVGVGLALGAVVRVEEGTDSAAFSEGAQPTSSPASTAAEAVAATTTVLRSGPEVDDR